MIRDMFKKTYTRIDTRYRAQKGEPSIPEGLWRNINDGEEYQGGREITVDAPLDQLPVFAKAGKQTEL